MDKATDGFIFCSREVIQDGRLTLLQLKVLLALYSFRNKNTSLCFPSRETISKRTGIRITRISTTTTQLEKLGWIRKFWDSETKKYNYQITVPELGTVPQSGTVPESGTEGVPESGTKGVPESGTHNYKENYKENLKTKEGDVYEEILADLNEKTGKNFKPTSKANRKWIDLRLKDGFTVEDFKAVNTNKAKDWNNSPEHNQYLRPETLYGNKFEGYLQQKEVTALAVQQAPPRFPSKAERDRDTSSHLKRSLENDRNRESNHSSVTSLFRKLPTGSD